MASIRTAAVLAAFALFTLVPVADAQADVLLDQTRTVSTGPAPVERAITVSQAGSLDVDVTDLGIQGGPLSALRAAVTRGDAIVGTPLTAAGRITFAADANVEYVVRVVGRPGANAAAGSAGVRVTRTTDPQPRTPLLEFVALFQTPNASTLDYTNVVEGQGEVVTFPEAGTYTATLTDFSFPAALSNQPALGAVLTFGAQTLRTIAPGAPVAFTVPSATAPGPAQYRLALFARATTAARAGLFGLRIVGGPANAVVFDRTIPVGALEAGEPFANPAAGNLTLQLRDAAYPTALGQVGAVLSAGGLRVGTPLTATGSVSVNAPAGPLVLWTAGTAGAQAGSYQASVTATAGATLVNRLRAVSSSAAGAPSAFLFPFEVATAGSYTARVTDFQFPSSLSAVQFAVLQNGAAIVQSTTGGTVPFTAAAGPAALYVLAQAPAGGSGLFGAETLTTGASPTNLLDRTQAVGAAFDTRPLTVATAGRYDVALRDVGWPANFQNLALAVTRGGQVVGRIFGGGTFFFDATPGQYLATLVATPSATEFAGVYAVRVRSSAPTVTLTANPATVASGQTTSLTWSTTAATACTAAGGWSGSRATSGTETSAALTANATYTLTCTGPGGSTSANASVTVTAPPPSGGGSGGGGGGALDPRALLALAALLMLRAVRNGARLRSKA
jgi:hypothetical protein